MSMLSIIAASRRRFTPLSLSPALWLDATTLSGADGTSIATWTDRSGNGRNATQSTPGAQPKIYNNVLHGRPVLRFDGTDDFLQTAAVSISQPYMTFVVFKSTMTSAQIVVSGADVVTTSGGVNLAIHWATGGISGINAGTLYAPIDTSANWQIFATLASGANSRVFRDGSSSATGNAGTNNISLVRVGRSSLDVYFNGDIAEILVFPTALSTADRQAVERYLAAKWGITLA